MNAAPAQNAAERCRPRRTDAAGAGSKTVHNSQPGNSDHAANSPGHGALAGVTRYERIVADVNLF